MTRDPSPKQRGVPPNRRRFEEFYRRHYAAVSHYVARRLPDESHDDIVARTFVIAWNKFERVEEPSLPWLYRIASFEVIYERRRLATQPVTTDVDGLSLPQVSRTGDIDDVEEALRQLSIDDAELLRLVHWEQLSRAEVALVLGCTVNTVNVRYHRAIERMSGALHRLANARQDQSVVLERPKGTI